ncbi:MAG TPA: saccharopine dehydrogenase C-terminal domain-containing protein [Planctomycetota bacterium]|nr:saccharopine dehydrogenase C-terminal domain-containing protein [Planctomycetota bacterium]
MKALVLGGGMVGSAIAADLAGDRRLAVTVADRSDAALARLAKLGLASVRADCSDPAKVTALASGADVVVGALSSTLGLATLRAVIEARKPYVDISFLAEDPLALSGLAQERGVTAVVDCGVAPGMSNLLGGHAAARLSPCERLEIYVGGLPAVRRWPYEYKAPFAPHDVLEEYTRPARLVEDGRLVVREALSEPELLEFEGVGTLEAFNTDGLRSLAYTLKVPWMKEKTMRYPGHIALMRVLRETGFFGKEPVAVRAAGGAGGEVSVRPLDVTAALLFPKWTFDEGEADLTVMRVSAVGREGGRRVRLQWDLLDQYDPETNTRSMSRTTGYPAAIAARWLLEKRFERPGVHPPETLGADASLVEEMLRELASRGVRYRESVTAA